MKITGITGMSVSTGNSGYSLCTRLLVWIWMLKAGVVVVEGKKQRRSKDPHPSPPTQQQPPVTDDDLFYIFVFAVLCFVGLLILLIIGHFTLFKKLREKLERERQLKLQGLQVANDNGEEAVLGMIGTEDVEQTVIVTNYRRESLPADFKAVKTVEYQGNSSLYPVVEYTQSDTDLLNRPSRQMNSSFSDHYGSSCPNSQGDVPLCIPPHHSVLCPVSLRRSPSPRSGANATTPTIPVPMPTSVSPHPPLISSSRDMESGRPIRSETPPAVIPSPKRSPVIDLSKLDLL